MKALKKLLKFVGVVAVIAVLLGIGAMVLARFNDWPVFVRDPSASLRWSDGESKGRGTVYWKPFSNEYIAEIDLGAGVFAWAWLDRAEEVVVTPHTPNRLFGMALVSGQRDVDLDPAPPDEEADDWKYAFSRSMATFDDGRYRCRLDF